ncbi:hypothetical protein LOTGIDRAFT_173108 [Lottia gigantea]|uniref:Uncharacterized protein n=1 Tax=Lottia gigantea TaxID=225164 RepID=V4B2Q5_LOTGI|nr:hypothetical protein LOTGIDRAFT_173108 [Lottia gigantea]ESP00752.1 hypothetical protein LOTGIDRAFT_173108 [Lottia gigantea]
MPAKHQITQKLNLNNSDMNMCSLIYFKRMDEDDYRGESEVEPDSDHDDIEEESQLSRWLANTNTHHFSTNRTDLKHPDLYCEVKIYKNLRFQRHYLTLVCLSNLKPDFYQWWTFFINNLQYVNTLSIIDLNNQSDSLLDL